MTNLVSLRELSRVGLLNDIPALDLIAGATGTIVFVFRDEGFMVEFVEPHAVITVSPEDIAEVAD